MALKDVDETLLEQPKSRQKLVGVSQQPLTLILLQKYRDTNGRRIVIQIGGVYTTFCQEEGILLQKYRDRNGRCMAILFKSIGVRGQFDYPESLGFCTFLVFGGVDFWLSLPISICQGVQISGLSNVWPLTTMQGTKRSEIHMFSQILAGFPFPGWRVRHLGCAIFAQCNAKQTQSTTLPALQKTFVDFFFEFAWGFCIENGGDFW